MILLLDNFDSFTYNLVDYFEQHGEECVVVRNDVSLSYISKLTFDKIVLSPGPETPQKAGILMDVLETYVGKLPILGICLGHQAIGIHLGASLKKARVPMHGKISPINTTNHPLFTGLPRQFEVVRYHSLILTDLPENIAVIAKTKESEVMAITHETLRLTGIQFHPESILTEYGLELLRNWLDINTP